MEKIRPVRLFFIRHGQTENFENPPFNGWRDAPLTDEGRKQLDQVAEALGGLKFEAVYSSDLSRAVYGGSRLAERAGLTLVPDPKWREMSFGRWEGLNYKQIAADDKDLIHQIFSADGHDLEFPGGGESSNSFSRRIKGALDDLLARHAEGGRVALVAHGGVCKALWGLILNLPAHIAWTTVRQDFAAVNVADIYPGGAAVAHLVNGYAGPEGYCRPGPGLDRLTGESVFS
ncbi:histidine phosphatase family protein [Deltaproteobacteria bacterium OttesenSCG-928-K17]|nr:histidine phosphatase family protein [Deltaproteobacteria bacterium OttesenSCG-928-K17]